MQRASSRRETQQETAGRILVGRVAESDETPLKYAAIFDEFGLSTGGANLRLADIAFHSAMQRMPAEFKFAAGELLTNVR